MRFTIPLLVAVVTVGLVACGGNDQTSTPPALAQRFVSAEDAPGSKPDPVEKRKTTTDYDTFISALSDEAVDPNRDETTKVFKRAAFVSAGQDARFFGATHSPETSVHVFSSFIELGSEDAAKSALDWLEPDEMKPCPMRCAVKR